MPDTNVVPQKELVLTELSDHDLIQLLPTPEEKRDLTSQERAVIEELWSRHSKQIIRKRLHIAIRSSHNPCPFHWNRGDFFKQAMSLCYIKFVERIRKRKYTNFIGYLSTLAYSAAIDEQRNIIGRINDLFNQPEETLSVVSRNVEHDNGTEEVLDPEDARLEPEKAISKRQDENRPPTRATGRTEQWNEEWFPVHSKLPNARWLAERNQRRSMIRELLERHASESPENALSTATLRLRFWNNYTWEEIADSLLRSLPLSLETRAKRVARFADKDCEKLQALLKEEFKVTDVEQL